MLTFRYFFEPLCFPSFFVSFSFVKCWPESSPVLFLGVWKRLVLDFSWVLLVNKQSLLLCFRVRQERFISKEGYLNEDFLNTSAADGHLMATLAYFLLSLAVLLLKNNYEFLWGQLSRVDIFQFLEILREISAVLGCVIRFLLVFLYSSLWQSHDTADGFRRYFAILFLAHCSRRMLISSSYLVRQKSFKVWGLFSISLKLPLTPCSSLSVSISEKRWKAMQSVQVLQRCLAGGQRKLSAICFICLQRCTSFWMFVLLYKLFGSFLQIVRMSVIEQVVLRGLLRSCSMLARNGTYSRINWAILDWGANVSLKVLVGFQFLVLEASIFYYQDQS